MFSWISQTQNVIHFPRSVLPCRGWHMMQMYLPHGHSQLKNPCLPHKLSVQVLHQSCGLGVFLVIVFQDYSWIRLEGYFYAFFWGGCMWGTHIRALCKPAHQWGAVTCFSFLVNWPFKIVCMGWGTCRERGASAKWWRHSTYAYWLIVRVPHSLVHAGTLGLACRMHLWMESCKVYIFCLLWNCLFIVCMSVDAHMPSLVWRSEDNMREAVSLSTMWVPGIELRLLGLAAGASTCWAL